MQNLQVMIDQLTKERHLHISILDLTGILNNTMTEISFKNVIHSKRFCDIAKQTKVTVPVCVVKCLPIQKRFMKKCRFTVTASMDCARLFFPL